MTGADERRPSLAVRERHARALRGAPRWGARAPGCGQLGCCFGPMTPASRRLAQLKGGGGDAVEVDAAGPCATEWCRIVAHTNRFS